MSRWRCRLPPLGGHSPIALSGCYCSGTHVASSFPYLPAAQGTDELRATEVRPAQDSSIKVCLQQGNGRPPPERGRWTRCPAASPFATAHQRRLDAERGPQETEPMRVSFPDPITAGASCVDDLQKRKEIDANATRLYDSGVGVLPPRHPRCRRAGLIFAGLNRPFAFACGGALPPQFSVMYSLPSKHTRNQASLRIRRWAMRNGSSAQEGKGIRLPGQQWHVSLPSCLPPSVEIVPHHVCSDRAAFGLLPIALTGHNTIRVLAACNATSRRSEYRQSGIAPPLPGR